MHAACCTYITIFFRSDKHLSACIASHSGSHQIAKVKSYIFALCKQRAKKHPSVKNTCFKNPRRGNQRRKILKPDSFPHEKILGEYAPQNSRSDPRPTTFPEFLRRRGVYNKGKARRKTQKRYFSHLRHSPHVTPAREPQPFSFAPVLPCRVPRVP